MIDTSRTSTVVALLAAVVLFLLPAAAAGATAQHAAGLVVDTGERVVTVYVPFPEGRETISGEELLRLADVDAVFADYGSMGKAVCSILGVGSPQDDCFREAERNGLYWNYSRAEDGGWQRSSKGVSSTTVEHGDVDGWAWGGQGSEPPYHTFEEIRERHEPDPSESPTPEGSPSEEQPAPPPQEEPPPQAETGDDPAPQDGSAGDTVAEPETADTPTEAPVVVATSPAETGDEPTSEPTATVEEEAPVPSSTPTPTASEEAVPLAVEDELAGTSRGLLSLLTFAVVMALLAGATVWRRRGRSGTHEGPRAP